MTCQRKWPNYVAPLAPGSAKQKIPSISPSFPSSEKKSEVGREGKEPWKKLTLGENLPALLIHMGLGYLPV